MKAFVLVVLLSTISCSSGAPALTKASYLKRSEAVCAQLERDGHALPEPAGPRDLPAYLTASTRITVRAKAKLDAVATRFGDRTYVRRIFLDPMAAQIKAVHDLMPAVVADSSKGSTASLDALKLPQADLQAMGVYGFHECRKVVGSR